MERNGPFEEGCGSCARCWCCWRSGCSTRSINFLLTLSHLASSLPSNTLLLPLFPPSMRFVLNSDASFLLPFNSFGPRSILFLYF